MKKFILLVLSALLMISCSVQRPVYNYAGVPVAEVLQMTHPELVRYYNEGVLEVTSIKESVIDGFPSYRVNYRFVRYYYYGSERTMCLRERFPEIYNLYRSGLIRISSVYKYVDSRTLEIRHAVDYRSVIGANIHYGPNIYYHNGTRYYYRPSPPPPPRPMAKPNKPAPPRPQAAPSKKRAEQKQGIAKY